MTPEPINQRPWKEGARNGGREGMAREDGKSLESPKLEEDPPWGGGGCGPADLWSHTSCLWSREKTALLPQPRRTLWFTYIPRTSEHAYPKTPFVADPRF